MSQERQNDADEQEIPSTTKPFEINRVGLSYYHCSTCDVYYVRENFYTACISRRQRRCKKCYDAFKHKDERRDSEARSERFYITVLYRLRNNYLTHCKMKKENDDLSTEVIKDIMDAWDNRSFLSGQTKDLQVARWDPAKGLDPENLVIYTKEELRRKLHLKIWQVMQHNQNFFHKCVNDHVQYRKKLHCRLKR